MMEMTTFTSNNLSLIIEMRLQACLLGTQRRLKCRHAEDKMQTTDFFKNIVHVFSFPL